MFGLADCNNFFCSCERVFNPLLEGRPVVVLSNNDGCIVARSNESKALGLKMGTPYYQVRDFLESNGVAVFSSNYQLYGDMSERVMTLLASCVPRLDIYSIDEAFLDFDGLGDISDIESYGHSIVEAVRRGTGIPISMGIAPTRTLAKMASRFAKKYRAYRGVCVIDTDEKRRKALAMFDIGDVWGIGRRMMRALAAAGVRTAADFVSRPASWVQARFTITGLRTWMELRGTPCISIAPLPHKQSIRTSRSFPDTGIADLWLMEEAVANFAASCAWKLRSQNTVCGRMRVYAFTSPFRTDVPGDIIDASVTFPVPTHSLQEIVCAAVGVLRAQWKNRGFLYKKAGVMVEDIVPLCQCPGDLFDTVDRPKTARLMRAINAINERQGVGAVRLAVQGYSDRWHIKSDHISRRYTTDIDQILRLNCK